MKKKNKSLNSSNLLLYPPPVHSRPSLPSHARLPILNPVPNPFQENSPNPQDHSPYRQQPRLKGSTLSRLFHLAPQLFHLAPRLFHLAPRLFHLAPRLFHLAPRLFHLAPRLFHLAPRLLPRPRPLPTRLH